MSLSKNRLKLLRSLSMKKYRDESGLFVAEGAKAVDDLLGHFDCQFLAATPSYIARHENIVANEIEEASIDELAKASSLKSAREVIAVFKQRKPLTISEICDFAASSLCIALDGVQDPGNLGTITRIADWFGIKLVVCSPNTADIYSAKAIQATMGALSRVKVGYADLCEVTSNLHNDVPVYGTLLDGDDIYSAELQQKGLIVMGSEGHGISNEIRQKLTTALRIPSYPPGQETSESLNVAMATAVVCAEFRRRALS